ncbi:putative DNA polymerase [Golovinomyces cichoracearum]|uniref:Probable DNA polymerase n=1 Tax=Golovinomyces cichoracearum TaxID=62708 RepID=A0A420IXA3_9PEZI|nr:putative DNA polymerase [Golovinomyces cichoracearum]
MDLETRTINNILKPYCVSIFDGKIKSSIFMINTLQKLSVKSLKPNRRNGKLIDVKFFFGKNYFIHFRDSYLLLPKSLKKLSLSFGVSKKGDFPHKFLDNSNIELNYSGLVPSRDFFYNLSESEYKEYIKLYKDKKYLMKKSLRILKYPTLPSLAFAIFRSNFLNNKTKIPIIGGQMYNYFKQGYTGGSCDMFKPYAKKPIYRYDVNSLYPAMMKNHQMPLGNPIYFEGDILKFMNKPLGVFKVKIDSPEEIKHPIIQSRLKVNGTSSTLSPLGS